VGAALDRACIRMGGLTMSVLRRLGVPVCNAEGTSLSDLSGYRLLVCGLVAEPLSLAIDEVRALPRSVVNARLTSVSGFGVRADWGGVLWTDFEGGIPVLAEARHAAFFSAGGYETTLPLADLRLPKVMLAWEVGGEPIEIEHGGPLRLVVPHLWGYKSCKWVTRIELRRGPRPGYWERRGHTDGAAIQPGTTADMNDSGTCKAIRGGGEVTEF
jgi:DMSO/TMAO reductase YedYZ molybdopterin-dependent catalytic subunit